MLHQDARVLLESVLQRAKGGRTVRFSEMELDAIHHALSLVRLAAQAQR